MTHQSRFKALVVGAGLTCGAAGFIFSIHALMQGVDNKLVQQDKLEIRQQDDGLELERHYVTWLKGYNAGLQTGLDMCNGVLTNAADASARMATQRSEFKSQFKP